MIWNYKEKYELNVLSLNLFQNTDQPKLHYDTI